jgi:hypothetical protein
LENEPERAYRAFECFLNFPSGERTLLEAFQVYTDNTVYAVYEALGWELAYVSPGSTGRFVVQSL